MTTIKVSCGLTPLVMCGQCVHIHLVHYHGYQQKCSKALLQFFSKLQAAKAAIVILFTRQFNIEDDLYFELLMCNESIERHGVLYGCHLWYVLQV